MPTLAAKANLDHHLCLNAIIDHSTLPVPKWNVLIICESGCPAT